MWVVTLLGGAKIEVVTVTAVKVKQSNELHFKARKRLKNSKL